MSAHKVRVQIVRLDHASDFNLPEYATAMSAGMDLSAAIEEKIEIRPGDHHLIPTGMSIALPEGYEAQVRPRSGLALKHGVTVLNAPGTIDADYRGEIKVILINHGKETFEIVRGMRIAQLIVTSFSHVEWQHVESGFGDGRGGGFGSTGLSHFVNKNDQR